MLQTGEQVRNIVGGDWAPQVEGQTTRWEVREGADGQGETLRHHVFLTAVAPGMMMGVVISTTKRVYYLTCKSVQTSPVRVVRWRYRPDPETLSAKPKEPGLLPDPAQLRLYHVGYALQGSRANMEFFPRQVVDDGKKTFIIYPEISLFERVPVIRLLGPNGPMLTNARQYLNVLIVDELIARAESATSGKAGGLKKVEPLKADRCCEPLKAVRL
jgi:type IV secretory pathway VirB9-like protein